METSTHILFYGHYPIPNGYNCFSQWFPCPFQEEINGKTYTFNSAEQYMMAHKALLFEDQYHFEEIMKSNNQGEIKKFGRLINNFEQNKWDVNKFGIVLRGNILKFSQNPKIKEILISTGNKIIVEASPYDKIWGIGLSVTDAMKINPSKWSTYGENLLGKALMETREQIA